MKKNIQVIDGALNCVYDIFSIEEEKFKIIFPGNRDIEFEGDLIDRLGGQESHRLLSSLWGNRVLPKNVLGIHGTLFFNANFYDEIKPYFPTKREDEVLTKL